MNILTAIKMEIIKVKTWEITIVQMGGRIDASKENIVAPSKIHSGTGLSANFTTVIEMASSGRRGIKVTPRGTIKRSPASRRVLNELKVVPNYGIIQQ